MKKRNLLTKTNNDCSTVYSLIRRCRGPAALPIDIELSLIRNRQSPPRPPQITIYRVTPGYISVTATDICGYCLEVDQVDFFHENSHDNISVIYTSILVYPPNLNLIIIIYIMSLYN